MTRPAKHDTPTDAALIGVKHPVIRQAVVIARFSIAPVLASPQESRLD